MFRLVISPALKLCQKICSYFSITPPPPFRFASISLVFLESINLLFPNPHPRVPRVKWRLKSRSNTHVSQSLFCFLWQRVLWDWLLWDFFFLEVGAQWKAKNRILEAPILYRPWFKKFRWPVVLLVRAQKSLGLVNGTPDYNPVGGFVAPDVPARTQSYSADGRLYAYALPTAWVSPRVWHITILSAEKWWI